MNQIKLYRKGGRKPWVFVWNADEKAYIHKTSYQDYKLIIGPDEIKIINFAVVNFYGETVYNNATTQIRADHFKLGNCKITF